MYCVIDAKINSYFGVNSVFKFVTDCNLALRHGIHKLKYKIKCNHLKYMGEGKNNVSNIFIPIDLTMIDGVCDIGIV